MMDTRFELIRTQVEETLSGSWAQRWSNHHKLWDHEQAKQETIEKIKLDYLDICLKAEKEIASSEERVKQEEMALEALRGKDMAHEDEIKNAVILLTKAQRELGQKRNLLDNKRTFLLHFVNMLGDEQYQWPAYPKTSQVP